jgi:hypothetical protein
VLLWVLLTWGVDPWWSWALALALWSWDLYVGLGHAYLYLRWGRGLDRLNREQSAVPLVFEDLKTDLPCDWCGQVTMTALFSVWSKADPVKKKMRLCSGCAMSCAGS